MMQTPHRRYVEDGKEYFEPRNNLFNHLMGNGPSQRVRAASHPAYGQSQHLGLGPQGIYGMRRDPGQQAQWRNLQQQSMERMMAQQAAQRNQGYRVPRQGGGFLPAGPAAPAAGYDGGLQMSDYGIGPQSTGIGRRSQPGGFGPVNFEGPGMSPMASPMQRAGGAMDPITQSMTGGSPQRTFQPWGARREDLINTWRNSPVDEPQANSYAGTPYGNAMPEYGIEGMTPQEMQQFRMAEGSRQYVRGLKNGDGLMNNAQAQGLHGDTGYMPNVTVGGGWGRQGPDLDNLVANGRRASSIDYMRDPAGYRAMQGSRQSLDQAIADPNFNSDGRYFQGARLGKDANGRATFVGAPRSPEQRAAGGDPEAALANLLARTGGTVESDGRFFGGSGSPGPTGGAPRQPFVPIEPNAEQREFLNDRASRLQGRQNAVQQRAAARGQARDQRMAGPSYEDLLARSGPQGAAQVLAMRQQAAQQQAELQQAGMQREHELALGQQGIDGNMTQAELLAKVQREQMANQFLLGNQENANEMGIAQLNANAGLQGNRILARGQRRAAREKSRTDLAIADKELSGKNLENLLLGMLKDKEMGGDGSGVQSLVQQFMGQGQGGNFQGVPYATNPVQGEMTGKTDTPYLGGKAGDKEMAEVERLKGEGNMHNLVAYMQGKLGMSEAEVNQQLPLLMGDWGWLGQRTAKNPTWWGSAFGGPPATAGAAASGYRPMMGY